MKSAVQRYPLLFFIAVFIASRLLGLGVSGAVRLVNPDLSLKDDLGWLLQFCYAGGAILLVVWAGLSKETGFAKPRDPKVWLLLIPGLAFPMFIFTSLGFHRIELGHTLLMLLAALFVSVNEETLFRGLLLRGFMRYGEYAAIFVPAFLFGAIHLPNVWVGADPMFSAFQAGWAFMIGVAYAAIRLMTQSLYPVIIAHFLVDASEYLATGETGIHAGTFPTTLLVQFVVMVFIFTLAMVVLFHRSRNTIKHFHIHN